MSGGGRIGVPVIGIGVAGTVALPGGMNTGCGMPGALGGEGAGVIGGVPLDMTPPSVGEQSVADQSIADSEVDERTHRREQRRPKFAHTLNACVMVAQPTPPRTTFWPSATTSPPENDGTRVVEGALTKRQPNQLGGRRPGVGLIGGGVRPICRCHARHSSSAVLCF